MVAGKRYQQQICQSVGYKMTAKSLHGGGLTAFIPGSTFPKNSGNGAVTVVTPPEYKPRGISSLAPGGGGGGGGRGREGS